MAPAEALYDIDELIDQTETILLVECTEVDTSYLNKRKREKFHVNYYVEYDFKIKEIIKGQETDKLYHVNWRPVSLSSDNFDNHTDSTFWKTRVGRSSIAPGQCSAQHSFSKGVQYLYFKESLANKKSTEIVNNNEDFWLLYVKSRVNQE
jgi:hypothetical protein